MAISLSKTGNAIKFTFENNAYYLSNGNIEVPLNSLALVTDDSEMFTFKKSATNDVFISGRYSDIGMTKSELESYFKENMVGSTGGGESGMTSGEVQTMIDESISGKADTSAVTEDITAAVSGKADSSVVTSLNGVVTGHTADTEIHVTSNDKEKWNKVDDKLDASAYTPTDLSNYYTKSQTSGATQISEALSAKADASVVNTLSGKVDINEEVVSRALNTLNTNKADTSAVTAALSGKQDTLSAGTNITISGNVISAEGGGKAIEAGRGISVTTGATADTVSLDLPLSADTGYNIFGAFTNSYNNVRTGNAYGGNAILLGNNNTIDLRGNSYGNAGNFVCGNLNTMYKNNTKNVGWNTVFGGSNYLYSLNDNIEKTFVCGNSNSGYSSNQFICNAGNKAYNINEFASGQYNISVSTTTIFGDSGNTLFSVGNGTANNARHNAFEIRQNGDIYVNDGTNDVRLQDTILALGGLKLVQISQSDYDNLQNKDSSTLYIIT
jgi:hypothetical protein